jgi:hypothetical protein
MHLFSILLLGLAYNIHRSEGLKKGECEVCISVLDRYRYDNWINRMVIQNWKPRGGAGTEVFVVDLTVGL